MEPAFCREMKIGADQGPQKGFVLEKSEPSRVEREIAQAANRLTAESPTAAALLRDFRAAGGRIEHSPNAGFFSPGPPPVIGISGATEEQRMQVLAHELGHFDFSRSPESRVVPPGAPGGISDHQIAQRREYEFITQNARRCLDHEGHAAIINDRIRGEVRGANGIDIGVAGDSPRLPMPLDPSLPEAEQRRRIGNFFGDHLVASTTREPYDRFCTGSYTKAYRQYLPGGTPNDGSDV